MKPFDLVGVGLNTTDTLLFLAQFPEFGGKGTITREVVSPGGQVASALSAAAKLGLRTKYIGTVGDDARGEMQVESLRAAGINLDDLLVKASCTSQHSYIIVDRSSGERTALSQRAACLEMTPERITETNITCARMLHIDGHDSPAISKAARIAQAAQMPVSLDVDSIYPGFETVFPHVDYLVSSAEFPRRWTGESDPFRALADLQQQYGFRVAAMTLGSRGALALSGGAYCYVPGFEVTAIDTTGAGDVFHGAFCYGVLEQWTLRETLEFSCAMAALNCTEVGARGGIRGAVEIRLFMKMAARAVDNEIEVRARR